MSAAPARGLGSRTDVPRRPAAAYLLLALGGRCSSARAGPGATAAGEQGRRAGPPSPGRSVVMMTVGLVTAIWALASLFRG